MYILPLHLIFNANSFIILQIRLISSFLGFLKPLLGKLGILQELNNSLEYQLYQGLHNSTKKIKEIVQETLFIQQIKHFLAQKSISNFIGQYLAKMDIIFFFYTLFRYPVQKIGSGVFFFYSKPLKLRYFHPGSLPVYILHATYSCWPC